MGSTTLKYSKLDSECNELPRRGERQQSRIHPTLSVLLRQGYAEQVLFAKAPQNRVCFAKATQNRFCFAKGSADRFERRNISESL